MSTETSKIKLPRTLLEASRYFADPDIANEFVASLRWPDGPECPTCGGKALGYTKTRRLWQCKDKACKRQFSVKVGSIFEDSAIPLDKWIVSVWMIANAKNGISSHELGRSVGLTQKSAWFVLHRIRLAMQRGDFRKFSGEVEVDETFVGGKARNMHPGTRARKITGTGGKDKTAVMGIIEREGEVRAMVVPDTRKRTLQPRIMEHVEPGSTVYSDAHSSYTGLESTYDHATVDHAVEYVRGQVHTNTMENFWSLLKRGLAGTYVSVEPFHLFRYLDEQVFRFNTRKANDFTRFAWVLGTVAKRRLTYAELTGKA
ncbi:MAG: IS1595 family transposase [Actinomycetota bacterium]|nr:IS1595 family transposase [Actinomycetota bacterium]